MFKILIKLFIKDYQNTDNPLVRNKYGILSGVVGITSNFLLAITKMITGFLIGSIAIVADGINNLMDGASSIITVIAFRLSILPPDREHPYGHQRIEYIGGLIVSILITVVGGILAQTSLDKILHPQPINIEKFSIIVIILSASILLKLWQSLFYRKAGKKIKSIALIATSQDSLNDCLTTFVVLGSIIVAKYASVLIDGYIGLALSIFIIMNGVLLIKKTVSPLLGEAPNEALIKKMKEKLLSYPGILGIHDLMVHIYGPNKTFASVHVEVDAHVDIVNSHAIIDQVELDFFKKDGIHLVIHMDPVDLTDEETKNWKDRIKTIISDIHPHLDYHDLRIIQSTNHHTIYFDLVVPDGINISDQDLKEQIWNEVKKIEPSYTVMITFDHHYLR